MRTIRPIDYPDCPIVFDVRPFPQEVQFRGPMGGIYFCIQPKGEPVCQFQGRRYVVMRPIDPKAPGCEGFDLDSGEIVNLDLQGVL